jgi:hypothetical protein
VRGVKGRQLARGLAGGARVEAIVTDAQALVLELGPVTVKVKLRTLPAVVTLEMACALGPSITSGPPRRSGPRDLAQALAHERDARGQELGAGVFLQPRRHVVQAVEDLVDRQLQEFQQLRGRARAGLDRELVRPRDVFPL